MSQVERRPDPADFTVNDAPTSRAVDTPTPPGPCGSVMAACQNDAGHPGAHWHPRVLDEEGVVPLRPAWLATPDPSVPERPDRKAQMAIVADWLDVGHATGRLDYAELLDRLGSIPERPAEPPQDASLREALTMVQFPHRHLLGDSDVTREDASHALVEAEKSVRAALAQQSTPESRDE